MGPRLVKGDPWLEACSRDAGVADDDDGTYASGADLARGAPESAAAAGSGKRGVGRAPGSGIESALFSTTCSTQPIMVHSLQMRTFCTVPSGNL